MEAIKNKEINASIEYVISDRPNTKAVENAKKQGIKTFVVDRKIYGESLSNEINNIIGDKVDLVVLAGFLSILSVEIIKRLRNRIINIHPSLIPSFCGNGMYGIKVHENALKYGVKVSGCTVHFVDEGCDSGPIILQKAVVVLNDDTPQSLQKRILIKEHESIVEAVKLISENKLEIQGRNVIIKNEVY